MLDYEVPGRSKSEETSCHKGTGPYDSRITLSKKKNEKYLFIISILDGEYLVDDLGSVSRLRSVYKKQSWSQVGSAMVRTQPYTDFLNRHHKPDHVVIPMGFSFSFY